MTEAVAAPGGEYGLPEEEELLTLDLDPETVEEINAEEARTRNQNG